jgi:integrase
MRKYVSIEEEEVDVDLARARRGAFLRRMGARRRGDASSASLLSFEEVRKALGASSRVRTGRRVVPLERIVGGTNLLGRYFKPLLKRAELPAIRLHDLRHTCATILLMAGKHPKFVQEMFGHANISITLDTYSHGIEGMDGGARGRYGRRALSPIAATGDFVWPRVRETRIDISMRP